METIFSHRSLAGVSVGARNVDGTLYVAFALVNDGSSRNGIFWQDRRDTFCRATARLIINGRINNAIANGAPDDSFMILSFETDMTARQFIAAFRPGFKPTPDETDNFLIETAEFGEGEEAVEVRYRAQALDIVQRLIALSMEVVANASARV